MVNQKTKGLVFAVIAALISGVSIFVNKFAVDAIRQPLIFTTVKNTGVAILLLLILLKSGKLNVIKKLTKKEKLLLTAIGIIGGSIPFYLFFKGLSMIPAINGAVIQKTLVLWVAIFALPILREKLNRKTTFLILFLFASNILVGGFKGFSFSLGELYVLLATIFWAIETIISKKILPKVDPDIVVEARMGIGAVVLLGLSVITKPQELMAVSTLSFDKWIWVIATTLLLLAYVSTWYRGLKFAPATTATAVLVGATLITNILSAIFITHTFNSLLTIQSILIVTGVYLLFKVESVNRISSKESTVLQ